MTTLLIIPIVWFATAFGSQLNRWLRTDPVEATPLERRLFGLAIGLLILSYSILGIGLFGDLYAAPILSISIIQAIVGFKEHKAIASDLIVAVKRIKFNAVPGGIALVFILYALVSLTGCFTPPTSLEYDALVYHLGDPKIYLAHHRIIYLPWESHSNFAFTMEMLYTLGLSVHSVPLAKLFHFVLGVTAAAGTFLIGKRAHTVWTGVIAALIFVSMPLVFWEAGTAYVDLAATAFGALSMAALIPALETAESDPAWLRVSMLMMGCMVSIKATSMIPLGLCTIGVLVVRYSQTNSFWRSFRSALIYNLGAIFIGSVWYVKSRIVTGNPFFPFAYSIFGGKHWSKANAAGYTVSQSAFGMGHGLKQLVLAPWNLSLFVLPWNVPSSGSMHPFNDFSTALVSLSPMLLATLFLPAFWDRQVVLKVKLLAVFGLFFFLIWFALTQQVRYLIPALPIYSVLAASVLVELWKEKSVAKYALAVLFAVSIVYPLLVGNSLVGQELPVVIGTVDQASFIKQGYPPYAAMDWINRSTPLDAGVVIYGEPEDFYLNRNHMWGEPGHGIVIPYTSMSSSDDLRKWMIAHDYQYIFINAQNARIDDGPGVNGLVYGLTYGSGKSPVFYNREFSVWQVE